VPKSVKKRPPKSVTARVTAAKPAEPTNIRTDVKEKGDGGSKQARVISMLESPSGTTIATMMKATGWQQHSVRGFLADVVRKKLKFNLNSEKIAGNPRHRCGHCPNYSRRCRLRRSLSSCRPQRRLHAAFYRLAVPSRPPSRAPTLGPHG
jgi:hypothetical protein